MKKVFSWLIQLIFLALIPYWVFWNTGHLVNFNDFKEGLMSPHTVDFAEVLHKYHFPMIVTLSLYFNLIVIIYVRKFYEWLDAGKIRIGGKAGND